jgi:hypothetical protein
MMRRPILLGLSTTLAAVAIAAAFALATHGRVSELLGFAVWSLPLGFVVGFAARKPRVRRWHPFIHGAIAIFSGFMSGVTLTVIGWFMIGGWMLAWDFPVLYCWSLAGVSGFLAAAALDGRVSVVQAPVVFVAAILPIAALLWIGNRPEPAVLVIYRDHPTRDAAQFVLDSILTKPHSSGVGRDLRWPSTGYLRTSTANGEVASLIALRRPAYRDSVRTALADHPLVIEVVDTVWDR